MDEVVGNLTNAIKAKPGMWEHTLVCLLCAQLF